MPRDLRIRERVEPATAAHLEYIHPQKRSAAPLAICEPHRTWMPRRISTSAPSRSRRRCECWAFRRRACSRRCAASSVVPLSECVGPALVGGMREAGPRVPTRKGSSADVQSSSRPGIAVGWRSARNTIGMQDRCRRIARSLAASSISALDGRGVVMISHRSALCGRAARVMAVLLAQRPHGRPWFPRACRRRPGSRFKAPSFCPHFCDSTPKILLGDRIFKWCDRRVNQHRRAQSDSGRAVREAVQPVRRATADFTVGCPLPNYRQTGIGQIGHMLARCVYCRETVHGS